MDFDNWARRRVWKTGPIWTACRISARRKPAISARTTITAARGPVSVTTPKAGNNELFHAMVEAGVQAGYPRTDDLNGYQQEGFGPMDRTVTPKGARQHRPRLSGSGAFAAEPEDRHPCADRPHCVRRQACGGRQLFAGRQQSTDPRQSAARKCCCAPAPSPRRRSCSVPGVGPAALLNRLDIKVVHDLPGVGGKSAGSPGDVPAVRL